MSLSPEQCLTKLNELKEWRRKQGNSLFEKQHNHVLALQSRNDSCEGLLNNENQTNRLINNNFDSVKTPLKIVESQFDNNSSNIDENNKIIKRAFLKRGEGLKSRFKIHPDKFKLENLPKYKYASKTTRKSMRKGTKSSCESNKVSKEAANIINKDYESPDLETYECDDFEDNDKLSSSEQSNSTDEDQEPRNVNSLRAPTWATVLNSKNEVDNSSLQNTSLLSTTEKTDLHLFEFLEQKVDSSSFLSNASSIVRLIGQNYKTDINLLDENKIKLSLSPNPRASSLFRSNDLYDSDESSVSEECARNPRTHVRFADNVLVTEIPDDNIDHDIKNKSFNLNSSITSTPIHNLNSDKCENDISQLNTTTDLTTENIAVIIQQLIQSKQKETEDRNELLKSKIKHFEDEINKFETHNKLLIKMQQEFEMQKIETENAFSDTRQDLEDEKIKIEIYLRDERNKLMEEKTKLEKARLNPTKKEREEITRLKEQIDTVQQEFKSKESRLTSGQSRLRAQIRNLEKQLKEKELEIEAIKKENKKLDAENIRLRRMNNNKMLAEINKNIAKLTPKNDDQNDNLKKDVSKNESDVKRNSRDRVTPVVISDTSSSSSDEIETPISTKELPLSSRTYTKQITPRSEIRDEDINSIIPTTEQVLLKNPRMNYSQESPKQLTVQNFKREISNPDGSKDIWYPNGNIKKISSDGLNYKMLYYNKDIKETNINEGTVKYYYAQTNTWHTTYLDGLEILEFPR